jgi:hypothetical protein
MKMIFEEDSFYNAISIKAEDGRELFSIIQVDNRTIEISAGDCCKVKDKGESIILDDKFTIKPKSSNSILLIKDVYK